MAVRKRGRTWFVDFWFNNKRYRLKGPENTKAGAEAYEASLRQKLARGESIDQVSNKENNKQPFEQFAWEWYESYVTTNNKASEQYAKQKILTRSLIPFFGQLPLDGIRGNHIEQFKAQEIRKVTNKTVNNRLTVLAKCLRCAHEWYGVEVPIIKKLKCSPTTTDYLTPTECDTLLSGTDGQMREMILLALHTGMRQGEIRGLQWSSIDWQERSLTVRHSRCDRSKSLVTPKNNRDRLIPLDTDVYELLFNRRKTSGYVFTNEERNNEPFTSHRLIEELDRICKRIQLRKITWHKLRHTVGTHLSLNGAPLTVVKDILGHSSITTTMRYSHVPPVALRSAIELLNPRNAAVANFGHQLGTEWQQQTSPNIQNGLN
ncbi:MAG TPA: tyrosine-type recombinase/integrase [Candidatus Paceibacterota bacterium]|nr:tyrosine-type recombinase/integrase [Candidatus Paceibacterota bacterium]